MDEKMLEELETFYRLGGLDDAVSELKNGAMGDLIRLARLGLWAERLGIPALKAIAPSWLPTNPRGLRRHALDHLPESTTASDGELPESDSQSHTPEEA